MKSWLDQLKKNKWFQLLVLGGIAIFIFKYISGILKLAKRDVTNDKLDAVASALVTSSGNISLQQAKKRAAELAGLAEAISKCIWGWQWLPLVGWYSRMDEDEDGVVKLLSVVFTADEAILLSQLYKEFNAQYSSTKGQSLKRDVDRYLGQGDIFKINTVVYYSIE